MIEISCMLKKYAIQWGTLLPKKIKKKKKQINAHKNLGELGIRMALHAKRTRDEKFILPSDGYTISRWEK